jgi:hypothetical protein
MGVLLMLMTVGGVLAALVLLAISFVTKKAWLRSFVSGAVAVWFVFYLVMLFGSSLLSNEKTLALNEPKRFCGFYLDCHMHTAVAGVQKTKTIGDRTAVGEFYIVKVNVFSDAVREPLQLIGTEAKVIDGQNRTYTRDADAEAKLGSQPAFDPDRAGRIFYQGNSFRSAPRRERAAAGYSRRLWDRYRDRGGAGRRRGQHFA